MISYREEVGGMLWVDSLRVCYNPVRRLRRGKSFPEAIKRKGEK